jgi:hypothetical protein
MRTPKHTSWCFDIGKTVMITLLILLLIPLDQLVVGWINPSHSQTLKYDPRRGLKRLLINNSEDRLEDVQSTNSKSAVDVPSSNSAILLSTDLSDKTIYQRAFYSFTPGSDVDIHKSIVIEERVRFQADPNRPGYIIPIGPRTLILRDGNVEDGEIGNDFYTIHMNGKHNGVGNDQDVEAIIATTLYLASNPTLCSGDVLQVGCASGLSALLGCIGASYVIGDYQRNIEKIKDDENQLMDDIFTISKTKDPLLPTDLERLILTDETMDDLELAMKYCQKSGIKKGVIVEQLDWRKRSTAPRMIVRRNLYPEYRTIVASDLTFSYPEAKELARTVANRLESSRKYYNTYKDQLSINPSFIHICPDYRNDVAYLRQFLEKGYKMTTSSRYLKLEQLKFLYQIALTDEVNQGTNEEENSILDHLDLELHNIKEAKYQCLVARHHPHYAGEGSGELFFPMETGEYDATGGTTFLEPEAGSTPW